MPGLCRNSVLAHVWLEGFALLESRGHRHIPHGDTVCSLCLEASWLEALPPHFRAVHGGIHSPVGIMESELDWVPDAGSVVLPEHPSSILQWKQEGQRA